MEFPVTLYQKIVKFLSSLPNIDKVDSRRAFIYSSVIDSQLEKQIQYDGTNEQFFQLTVRILKDYEKLNDGRYALVAILEAAKNYVGQDRRIDCDNLLHELSEYIITNTQNKINCVETEIIKQTLSVERNTEESSINHKNDTGNIKKSRQILLRAFIILIMSMISSNIYTGITTHKIGIPWLFMFKLNDKKASNLPSIEPTPEEYLPSIENSTCIDNLKFIAIKSIDFRTKGENVYLDFIIEIENPLAYDLEVSTGNFTLYIGDRNGKTKQLGVANVDGGFILSAKTRNATIFSFNMGDESELIFDKVMVFLNYIGTLKFPFYYYIDGNFDLGIFLTNGWNSLATIVQWKLLPEYRKIPLSKDKDFSENNYDNSPVKYLQDFLKDIVILNIQSIQLQSIDNFIYLYVEAGIHNNSSTDLKIEERNLRFYLSVDKNEQIELGTDDIIEETVIAAGQTHTILFQINMGNDNKSKILRKIFYMVNSILGKGSLNGNSIGIQGQFRLGVFDEGWATIPVAIHWRLLPILRYETPVSNITR